ncbi:MAG: hypothetical protein Q9172_006060 [Xanthocarpia lactea]
MVRTKKTRGHGRGRDRFLIGDAVPKADSSAFVSSHARVPASIGDPDAYPLERFSLRKPIQQNHHPSLSKEPAPTLRLNTAVREYIKDTTSPEHDLPFLQRPEIPSSEEISVPANDEEEEVPVNHVVGPWASKQKYLSDHYSLLREDGVAPLRNVVSELKAVPDVLEKDSVEQSQIYEKASMRLSVPIHVFIVGLTFAHGGIAAKVTFSLRRTGKKIIWEQSKRLLQGTLVALTPAQDMFKSICKVAVVAARPLSGVQSNPPAIDIFFGDPNQIEIDPQQEWVMVESSGGYFEAYRHTLKSLQKIAIESFPLAEYIVGVEREPRPPHYVKQQPFSDMSSIFQASSGRHTHVDILNGEWPHDTTSDLDASQLEALRRILTKELAIIQGPPGTGTLQSTAPQPTLLVAVRSGRIDVPVILFPLEPNFLTKLTSAVLGKTYVSVVALKVLLENKRDDDPPILVAAQTNHALDQLLRHIAPIESKFIRLGGMTSDNEIIKPRTLYEVKQATKLGVVPGGLKGPALAGMRALIKEIHALLKPLTEGKALDEDVLKAHKILTEDQCKFLLKGAEKWVDTSLPDSVTAAIHKWAGEELVEANRRTQPEDYGFDYEEIDLEYEQLKELEAEGKVGIGDDDNEVLRGERLSFSEPWTGREQSGRPKDDWETILRTTNDLWQIAPESRGPLYRHMQQRVKEIMTGKMRQLAAQYAKRVTELKIGKWEVDTNYLKESNIIGCTATGIAKYRALLHSLQPKIVLIEEAAETLEAQITAACFDSLEHLILVGDHQQLRGRCNERELEGEPWFLDVSMFERLVRNHVGFTQLTRQRRMHPEIRRGLMPIYPNLEDHPSVVLRPAVPGMGLLNTYFFSHTWPEDTDDLMSKVNRTEADMVVSFFNYLIKNGVKTKDVTVLTFYNGQRKLILSGLRRHANLQGESFKVVTVDSYQGEENGIVLLSLVRSNWKNQIGFLSNANRVCVALSRAQRGFYLFGDAGLLSKQSHLWFKLVHAMSQNPRRVGFFLPLTCQKHQIRTYAKHRGAPRRRSSPPKAVHSSRNSTPSQSPSKEPYRFLSPHSQALMEIPPEAQAFRNFADGGYVAADAAAALSATDAAAKERLRQLDADNGAALFGGSVESQLVSRTNELKLTATRQTRDGTTRNIYEGLYSSVNTAQTDRKQECSLLD